MLILVDQDDTLADFDSLFLDHWRMRYPSAPYVMPEQRRNFYLRDDYVEHVREQIPGIYCAPGFFRGMPPISGGIEAVKQMLALGHDVRICTSPLEQFEHCVLEKFQWVEQHLGREFTRRIILTYDKTLVRGDLLIDDRPDIQGALTPVWEHVIFDQAFNRSVTGKRRLNWSNWREVLEL